MEICAGCGKPIGMLEASYYRTGDDDIGTTYHYTCGDPFSVKAKDDLIAQLTKELGAAKAALAGTLQITIPQKDFATKSDEWLHGFEAGVEAAQAALTSAKCPEAKS